MTEDDVERFRSQWLEAMPAVAAISDRISLCLWFDLLVFAMRYRIDSRSILLTLLDLELGEPPNGLKPATQFTRLPLKGLWHKHWFSARFLPSNLLAVARKKDSMDWIWDIAKEGDILTDELIKQLAHRMTIQAYEERHAAKQMTGEWLIYLPRSGVNHYLCLGTHKTGDNRLYDKIRQICARDFPDIVDWMAEAAAAA